MWVSLHSRNMSNKPRHAPSIRHLPRLRVGRHFELDYGPVVVYPMALEPGQLWCLAVTEGKLEHQFGVHTGQNRFIDGLPTLLFIWGSLTCWRIFFHLKGGPEQNIPKPFLGLNMNTKWPFRHQTSRSQHLFWPHDGSLLNPELREAKRNDVNVRPEGFGLG